MNKHLGSSATTAPEYKGDMIQNRLKGTFSLLTSLEVVCLPSHYFPYCLGAKPDSSSDQYEGPLVSCM